MDVKNLNEVKAFVTKDGSEIRELLAYRNSSIRSQSLAEARLAPGAATVPHFHPQTEEIYYITHGRGEMVVNGVTKSVAVGDAIAIPPGQTHQITNRGTEMLRFLCMCVPAYEDHDTIMVDACEWHRCAVISGTQFAR